MRQQASENAIARSVGQKRQENGTTPGLKAIGGKWPSNHSFSQPLLPACSTWGCRWSYNWVEPWLYSPYKLEYNADNIRQLWFIIYLLKTEKSCPSKLAPNSYNNIGAPSRKYLPAIILRAQTLVDAIMQPLATSHRSKP